MIIFDTFIRNAALRHEKHMFGDQSPGDTDFTAGANFMLKALNKALEQRNHSVMDQGEYFCWQDKIDEYNREIVALLEVREGSK